VLLAYVDESFDQDYYWIAALVVTEDALIPLARALDAVVAKAATSTRASVRIRSFTVMRSCKPATTGRA